MLNLNVKDLWKTSRQEIIDFKQITIDEILKDRIDALVNHFDGNLSEGTVDTTIPTIDNILNNLSEMYFRNAKLRKDEIEEFTKFKSTLLLLKTTVSRNARSLREEAASNKKEIPQRRIANDDADYYKEMWTVKNE